MYLTPQSHPPTPQKSFGYKPNLLSLYLISNRLHGDNLNQSVFKIDFKTPLTSLPNFKLKCEIMKQHSKLYDREYEKYKQKL